jgi:hypothetical protein
MLLLTLVAQMAAQHTGTDTQALTTWEHDHTHLVGAGVGFTLVPLGDELGETDARGLYAPNVGLEYFYRIKRRWGAGFIGVIELDHYVVTDDQVERENALNLTLVGMYTPVRYLDVFLGGGVEIEQHDNLALLRLGTQYSMLLGQHWALIPRLYFDFKGNYNTWTLSLSIARRF